MKRTTSTKRVERKRMRRRRRLVKRIWQRITGQRASGFDWLQWPAGWQ